VPEHTPLSTLLAWVWIAHTIEVDNSFEAATAGRVGRHVRISLPMWTNGLRFIEEDGITVDDLRTSARASCNIAGLERWGWISVGNDEGMRRDGYGSHRKVKGDTVLYPTRAGIYARRVWPRVLAVIEDRWRSRFGDDVIDELGAAALAAVASMPWSPPEVNPSDGFRSHIVESDVVDHDRPLVVLLGQALTALTLDYERTSLASLPLGANALRVLGEERVRMRDLPKLSGLSVEGIAMAVSFLQRQQLAVLDPGRELWLTFLGLEAKSDYEYLTMQPKNLRLQTALAGVLAQSDALRAGLVPHPGCWRAEKPYLAQTERLLADPTGAMPWHPMVLHRGGWPDAS
jgi:hypothetical protein